MLGSNTSHEPRATLLPIVSSLLSNSLNLPAQTARRDLSSVFEVSFTCLVSRRSKVLAR